MTDINANQFNTLNKSNKKVKEIASNIEEVESEIPVEIPKNSEANFKWDGVVRAGLFSKLVEANISELEEKKWVKKFAKEGLAFQVITDPISVDKEVVTDGPRDPDDTWIQYKQFKDRKNNS